MSRVGRDWSEGSIQVEKEFVWKDNSKKNWIANFGR